ncbi:MAG: putative toxin-antitoxin system toxin component, PIN family [Nitrospirae bacterium]|nr:putative toxin-antitoxin system toxin component, PIN family [Nitrospirota bacterium]
MPKAVLDTNVLISAVITPRGTPAKLLQAWREGTFDLITSPPLLFEIEETLSLPKIAQRYRLSPEDIRDVMALFAGGAILVTGATSVSASISDPDDIPVLACAVEGQADYLVTGDGDLLRLRSYQRIQIIQPTDFLRTLSPSR